MATIGDGGVIGLADAAVSMSPSGDELPFIEMLTQDNGVIRDSHYEEANNIEGHVHAVRTALPPVTAVRYNEYTAPTKGESVQVRESIAMYKSFSDVPFDLATYGNSDPAPARMREAMAHMESHRQNMAEQIFYGNSSTSDKEFLGLSARYSTPATATSDTIGRNVIDAGNDTDDENASIWLICWGPRQIHMIYPKGSVAGFERIDLGRSKDQNSSGENLIVYSERFCWKAGLVVADWRYAVRIGSIDVAAAKADLGDTTFTYDLLDLMIQAMHRIPAGGLDINSKFTKPRFYCNRDVRELIDRQARRSQTYTLDQKTVDGRMMDTFRGVPIVLTDALLSTEDLV